MSASNPFLRFISDSIAADPTREKIFNWNEVSKIPLDDQFINAHAANLNWDLMSQYQPLSLDTINRFEKRINYNFLAKNPNLSSEVLMAKSDRMDWKTVQIHQKMTPELVEHFRDQTDPMIMLRYQKLTPGHIMQLLNTPMERRQLPLLKAMFDTVLEHQRVTQNLIQDMLTYEDSINPKEPTTTPVPLPSSALPTSTPSTSTPPVEIDSVEVVAPTAVPSAPVNRIVLVDLQLVAKYQTVDTDFVRKYLNTPALLQIACQFQKLNNKFLEELFTDQVQLQTLGNRLLRYQQLGILMETDMFTNWLLANPQHVPTFLKYQKFDYPLMRKILDGMPLVNESSTADRAKLLRPFYNVVFLRTLHNPDHDEYLDWPVTLVESEVAPNVNWETVVSSPDISLTTAQIDNMIARYAKQIPWYIFVKNNHLSEAQLTKVHESRLIGAIHWWIILTNKRPKGMEFSDTFMNTHRDKQKWWCYIPKEMAESFYASCIEVIRIGSEYDSTLQNVNRNSVRTFLQDFVAQADWPNILRYEPLEEWFIRIFQNYADRIDNGLFWWKVARYQKLTPGFINRHMENLSGHLNILLGYQKVTSKFLEDNAPFFDDDSWDKVRQSQNDALAGCSEEFKQTYAQFLSR